MFHLWTVGALKTEATRQAGARKRLKFGPMPEDELGSISNANKPDLVNGLQGRMDWRETFGPEFAEWRSIPAGITPEKKKKKAKKALADARKKAGEKVGKTQSFCCRFACLALHPDFSDDYLRFKGGSDGTGRAEQDAKCVGERHRFFVRVAKSMATTEWLDTNGNPLSIPDDHSNDDRASPNLKALLQGLDLEGVTETLQKELQVVFKGDEAAFYTDLQGRCFKWLKEVRAAHTVSARCLTV